MIGADGKQLGVMPTHIARRIAEEKGLDLVEVNPKGQPPVCKIVDYGAGEGGQAAAEDQRP